MTELKPIQAYEVVAEQPGVSSLNVDGDGKKEIDETSRQTAMARAMIENEKRQREQVCGAEIDATITAILKKHRCQAKFMELREGGQTTRIWLQPVSVDEMPPR